MTLTNSNANQPVVIQAVVQTPQSSLQTNEAAIELMKQKIPAGHIMRRIAFCESANRQFDNDGSVLRGRVDSRDMGMFQINSYYHGELAQRKGLDIATVEGNIDYAIDLYDREGTRPWNSSKPCWGTYLAAN